MKIAMALARIFWLGTCWQLIGQSTRPAFIAVDVHATRSDEPALWVRPYPDPRSILRTLPVHDGLLELKGATMLDLVAAAYGWEPYKIVGGPNWLEMDRFDLTAQPASEAQINDRKLMLQRLLEERFKLVVHEDTKPVLGYALTAGKRTALERANGSEKSGCVSDVASRQVSSSVRYHCRNISMEAFADGLSKMTGVNLATGTVLDRTALNGPWNFDVHWGNQSVHVGPPDHLSVFDALDQQLGLKLEEKLVPAPALVVLSVNRTPTPNSPAAVRMVLPPALTRFELASIRPSDPRSSGRQMRKIEPKRLTIEMFPMRYLFDIAFPDRRIEKMPDWAETETFNIQATVPTGSASLTSDNLAAPMLALLKDRFRFVYHTEQRPGPAYLIEPLKAKLAKADPTRRSSCRRDVVPSVAQGVMERVTCQNISMAQFAVWFSHYDGIGLLGRPPVLSDRTGLQGSWDFTLVYGNVRTPDPGDLAMPGPGQPAAPEPDGVLTVFEAFQRQLGLKLVLTSAPVAVIVIDHLDRRPTEQ